MKEGFRDSKAQVSGYGCYLSPDPCHVLTHFPFPILYSSPRHHHGADFCCSRLPEDGGTGIQCRSGRRNVVNQKHGSPFGGRLPESESPLEVPHPSGAIEAGLRRRITDPAEQMVDGQPEMLPKPCGKKGRLIELALPFAQGMKWHGNDRIERFPRDPGIPRCSEQEIAQHRGKRRVTAIFEAFDQLPANPLIAACSDDTGKMPAATVAIRTSHHSNHRMRTHRAKVLGGRQDSAPTLVAEMEINTAALYPLPEQAASAGYAMCGIKKTQQRTQEGSPSTAEQGISHDAADKAVDAGDTGAGFEPGFPRASALRAE